MRRRSLLLGACCSFLAGIGATAVAAYVATELQRGKDERRDTATQIAMEKAGLTMDIDVARKEAAEGRSHVHSLLRRPRVSETDHQTDVKAAQDWLRRTECE